MGRPQGALSSPPLPRCPGNPAVLGFLRDTRVGEMPGLALFGFQGSEEDLQEIDLWPEDEAGSGSEGEGGPGPP